MECDIARQSFCYFINALPAITAVWTNCQSNDTAGHTHIGRIVFKLLFGRRLDALPAGEPFPAQPGAT